MVMSLISLPRVVILVFMPVTKNRSALCSLASSGMQEVCMIEVEHTESSIAGSEKVVPLMVKLALMNRDCFAVLLKV